MSHNQSKSESREYSHYRKTGRSGSFGNHQRGGKFGGYGGGGGGTGSAPPPLSSSRSFNKKYSNVQGGQSKPVDQSVSSDSTGSTPLAGAVRNGTPQQQPFHDAPAAAVNVPDTVANSPAANAAAVKPVDAPTHKVNRAVPRAPSSNVSAVSAGTTPATPSKAPGDGSKSFALQFGSISPGLMNGMQIPARTSSAPPNIDEQKHDQARQEARAMPILQNPSAPKQQVPRKDVGTIDQPNTGEANSIFRSKRDVQVSTASSMTQPQKPSGHPVPSMAMQMPYHQPQVPVQFSVPSPQLQSQAMSAASLSIPMNMPMPLSMGNPPMQQPIFISGYQPHPLQSQGIMHQGSGLNFSSQMGPQLPPQLNRGINMSPPFPQQQTGKVGGPRKSVRITHPDTREELKLDGSPGPRSHPNMPPHSQAVPSFPPNHPINYYPNSYNAGSLPFPATSSTQMTPISQPPRLLNQVTVKPPRSSHQDKDLSQVRLPIAGKAELLKHPTPHEEVPGQQLKDSGISSKGSGSLEQSGLRSVSIPVPLSSKQSSFTLDSVSGQSSSVLSLPAQTLELETVIRVSADTSETTAASGDVDESQSMIASIATDASLSSETILDNVVADREPDVAIHEVKEEVSHEGSKEINKEFEGSSVPSADLSSQVEENSDLKDTSRYSDTGSSAAIEKKLEETPAYISEGVVAGQTVTTQMIDAGNAQTSSIGSSSHVGSISAAHGPGVADTKESAVTKSDTEQVAKPVLAPSSSEPPLNYEDDDAQDTVTSLVSPSSGAREKTSDSSISKSALIRGKKKRKELFKRADAAGTTSDLYMAYKGPEEKKETGKSIESGENASMANSMPNSADISTGDIALSDKAGQSKAEPDDWEDAADISTPKLETSDNGEQVDGGYKNYSEDGNEIMIKKYSRDFLLKFADLCIDLPEGFEITSETDALMSSSANVPRESYPSPGRVLDRPGSRTDRRGGGMVDEDKWNKLSGSHISGRDIRLDMNYMGNAMGFRPVQGGNYGVLRNPRAQTPVQYAGGILSGPMQSVGSQGVQRNGVDSDRWQRGTAFQKGLMPSPQTPLPVMHKAERKYQVGKVTDEEEAKQRQLKGILNKLTPQNFEKLFQQVKEVNIDNGVTLTGVISQIFDKALMEPTFCEMYANFCYHLASDLPDLTVDNEKITFKRLLLNKCQEEFERGEREEEEAKEDDDGEKLSKEEREERRLKARRRMLGNIRLIGELYKKRMLTERIMHDCIKKLLGQNQNPDEENIEALCKLMSTIGEMIDHPKAKEHMDAYFDMMGNLSNNMKLSSRVRFMLKDSIDLRKNKWQQRRKVEGPKKIEDVHRDAAQERQAQTSRLSRAPSIGGSTRRGQPMDFAPRGSSMLSSPSQMSGFRGVSPQVRGYGNQDARFDDRNTQENRTLSVPLHRPLRDASITLGPQGGLARGMSFRGQSSTPMLHDMASPGDSRRMASGLNDYGSIQERPAYNSREDLMPRNVSERPFSSSLYDHSSPVERNTYSNRDRSNDPTLPMSQPLRDGRPTSAQNVSDSMLSEERLRDLSIAAIREFYSAKDENEVTLCIKDLNAPSFYPSMISIWVTDSFERKDMERDLLAKLLVNLARSGDGVIRQDQLARGFETVLTTLEDAVNDAPKAAEFLGRIFAQVILENVIPFDEVGRMIYEGGEEQGQLVEIGLAADVLGSILEIIKLEKGDSVLTEICKNSNLQLESFRPPGSKKQLKLDKFIKA